MLQNPPTQIQNGHDVSLVPRDRGRAFATISRATVGRAKHANRDLGTRQTGPLGAEKILAHHPRNVVYNVLLTYQSETPTVPPT